METIMNKCMGWCGHPYMGIAARVFLSAIFVIVGFNKLINFSSTAQFIGSSGLPMPEVLTALAIIFELGGGVMLLLGWKKRIAIFMLIVFTVLATVLFHLKNLTIDQVQQIMFLKNLAIVGGLIALWQGSECSKEGCANCANGTCSSV
ncbi:MAG: DoxX family protein [Patescibacteria group bacterium]|mgnify:CR=1 FL=1